MIGRKNKIAWYLGICAVCAFLLFANSEQKGAHVITMKNDKVVLYVLAGQSTSDAGIEDMIDEALKTKFPHVSLEWECVDWGDNFDSQMLGRFAAGDSPDIMIGKAQDVYAYAGEGNLAPIRIEGMDKIKKSALEAVSIDGVTYAVPYNAMYQGVLYNKKVFEELNLEPPKTRKDLKEIVKVLKQNDRTPFASHFQESWNVGNMTMQFFMNDIFRKTENWGDLFRERKVGFQENEEVAESLKQNRYILANSWEDALIIDQFECDRRFFEREAAMYLTGTWSLQSVNQYGQAGNYGIFPYPGEEEGAFLIRETNMSFMKGSRTKYGRLIDDILKELLANETLMKEILDFTQTYSVVEGVDSASLGSVDQDIQSYERDQKIIEVSAGNNQLIWPFQKELAEEQLKWLQGKQEFKEVLVFADYNRMDSIRE